MDEVYEVSISISSVEHVVEITAYNRKDAQSRTGRFVEAAEQFGLNVDWFEVSTHPIRHSN